MHYTSVPNILKVLNPLFLDDLRVRLVEAGDNSRMLLNLRRRMARIRVFDPACGSGNFLVIAYKEIRAIEAEINRRRKEDGRKSDIPLTNFRGIELRDFPAEIARLALIIAEYQCDVLYRGQKEALAEFLPLNADNWITCGNALRLDWLTICPPTGTGVKLHADDLFHTPLDQTQIDFENEGGETYICGNPPYLGFTWQSGEQKAEIRDLLGGRTSSSGFLDYVAGWFIKAAGYQASTNAVAAFVATNSICQGQSVTILWPVLFRAGCDILFAYTSFRWSNLASNKAGVTVVVVGIGRPTSAPRRLFQHEVQDGLLVREGTSITPYLTLGPRVIVEKHASSISNLSVMEFGNKPSDGDNLLLEPETLPSLHLDAGQCDKFIRRIYGSDDFINGGGRLCIWIQDRDLEEARSIESIVPTLTDKNKADLTRCAENILLAREVHFPATIADLYDPEAMPTDLREAHERNDEVLERVYIGRRFKNDTERLEKLFDHYTKMTASMGLTKKRKAEAGA